MLSIDTHSAQPTQIVLALPIQLGFHKVEIPPCEQPNTTILRPPLPQLFTSSPVTPIPRFFSVCRLHICRTMSPATPICNCSSPLDGQNVTRRRCSCGIVRFVFRAHAMPVGPSCFVKHNDAPLASGVDAGFFRTKPWPQLYTVHTNSCYGACCSVDHKLRKLPSSVLLIFGYTVSDRKWRVNAHH